MNHLHIKTPIGNLCIVSDSNFITGINFNCENEKSNPNELALKCKEQLTEYFDKKRTTFTIPILPHGTDFQISVWKQLLNIPYGRTSSYLEIAKELGDKRKLRAVGNANSKNPIPIIIPCHRVIGSNGNLVGYAGGLDNKEWLLKHEGAIKQLQLFNV